MINKNNFHFFDYGVTLIIGLARGDWAYDDYDVSARDEWQAVEIARARMFEKMEEKFDEDAYMFNVVYQITKLLKDQ